MSHWTKIKFGIKDMAVLKHACDELGLDLVQGIAARGYAGEISCDYAIKIPNARFDVALNLNEHGEYTMQTDFWDARVGEAIGQDGNKLKQGYTVSSAELEAQRQGYSVVREYLDNGNVELTVDVTR